MTYLYVPFACASSYPFIFFENPLGYWVSKETKGKITLSPLAITRTPKGGKEGGKKGGKVCPSYPEGICTGKQRGKG